MKLSVIGCSPAWPNPGGAHSGYLVETAGDQVLLDCGPGVLSRLRTRRDGAPWPAVGAIVISHLHLDHIADLVPWLWGRVLGPARGRAAPELWLPPGGLGRLTDFAAVAQFETAFDVREYVDGRRFTAGGHDVTPVKVVHYDEPTWGLRVERDGAVLAYSADTAPTPALIELADGADAFLCEATLVEPEPGQRGHMTADEARAAADAAGAGRLLVTHRSVELPVDELVYDGFELDL